jgi:cytochrome c
MIARRPAFSLMAGISAALALGSFAAQSADRTLLQRGRIIAKTNCARCHAIGTSGASANPKAPPFRHIARKYPLANLEEALAEGIVVGHEGPEMPRFALTTEQIEALLAYLTSIQKK